MNTPYKNLAENIRHLKFEPMLTTPGSYMEPFFILDEPNVLYKKLRINAPWETSKSEHLLVSNYLKEFIPQTYFVEEEGYQGFIQTEVKGMDYYTNLPRAINKQGIHLSSAMKQKFAGLRENYLFMMNTIKVIPEMQGKIDLKKEEFFLYDTTNLVYFKDILSRRTNLKKLGLPITRIFSTDELLDELRKIFPKFQNLNQVDLVGQLREYDTLMKKGMTLKEYCGIAEDLTRPYHESPGSDLGVLANCILPFFPPSWEIDNKFTRPLLEMINGQD